MLKLISPPQYSHKKAIFVGLLYCGRDSNGAGWSIDFDSEKEVDGITIFIKDNSQGLIRLIWSIWSQWDGDLGRHYVVIIGVWLSRNQNLVTNSIYKGHRRFVQRQVADEMVSASSGNDISLVDLRLHPRSFFVRGHMGNIVGKEVEVFDAFLRVEEAVGINPNNYMEFWLSLSNLVKIFP